MKIRIYKIIVQVKSPYLMQQKEFQNTNFNPAPKIQTHIINPNSSTVVNKTSDKNENYNKE